MESMLIRLPFQGKKMFLNFNHHVHLRKIIYRFPKIRGTPNTDWYFSKAWNFKWHNIALITKYAKYKFNPKNKEKNIHTKNIWY